jgi:hypothetical protein
MLANLMPPLINQKLKCVNAGRKCTGMDTFAQERLVARENSRFFLKHALF